MSRPSASMNSTIVRSNLAFAWRRLALESAFAPPRAASSAERLFTTPPRFGHTPRELEWLAQGTRFSVPTKAGALAAWRFGESHRSAVVFSHGWGGRGAQLRHFGPALLEAHFQVVVFDHGAHGMSSGREASLVHFVDDLGAVIAAIESQGARLAGLIGHSLGAGAGRAVLNATERTTRAVLIASPTSIVRHARYFARRWGLSDSVTQAMQERLERRLGHRWAEFELPQSVAKVRAAALVIHDADDLDVAPA